MITLSLRLRAYIEELKYYCRFPLILENINDPKTKRKYGSLPSHVRAFVFLPDNQKYCSVVADWQATAYDPEYEAIAAHELGHLWFHAKGLNQPALQIENNNQLTLFESDLVNTLVEDPVCDSMAWLRDFAIDKALLHEFDWLFSLSAPKLVMNSHDRTNRIKRSLLVIRVIASEFLSSDQKAAIVKRFRVYDNISVQMALDYYDRTKEIVHSTIKSDHTLRLTHALSLFFGE